MGKHDKHQEFSGRRWLTNLLRAAHLVGVAGVGAGVLGGWPPAQWHAYAIAVLSSGLGIFLLDWWANLRYPVQINGLSVLLKLALAGWLVAQPAGREWVFWVILVFSSLIAHAPGRVRHREVITRR